ncbi:MAG: patatin-like phospholipase family protein [Sphingobium sp.]
MRKLLLFLPLMLLCACATRGSLDVDCAGFTEALPGKTAFRRPLPLSPLERQIRGLDEPTSLGGGQTESGLLTRTLYAYQHALFRQQLHESDPLKENPDLGAPAVLLLSGGGQWGAFGAGFLSRLAEKGEIPNFFVVTGVSTGGMQAMFVGSDHPDRWQWLRDAYSIDREKEVVKRNSKLMAIVTGSFAGLNPLRRRIETALCAARNDTPDCVAIEALKASDRQVLIGYIEARSGDFFYSDVHQIASETGAANARACIAGSALASSAMPVTFQQVRINGRAYYDGGVRQSVFASFAEQLGRLVQANDPDAKATGAIPDLPFYVVRNGPTGLLNEAGSDKADRSPSALTAAERAQQIVTNQIEVGSVAALRLQKPDGAIRFVSADGWERHGFTTRKGKTTTCGAIRAGLDGRIFDPDFMDCLMDYGRERADAADPWRALMTIGADREAVLPAVEFRIPKPANDN